MAKLTPEDKALVTKYGHLFTHTGGNDIIELIEREGVNYFSNAIVAELQGSCVSQLHLLKQLVNPKNKGVVLTCVYCGATYPAATTEHGEPVLTAHIKVCEKHPLRKSEADNARLRSALEGLVGASDPGALRDLGVGLALVMPPDHPEREALFFAINTLLEVPSA